MIGTISTPPSVSAHPVPVQIPRCRENWARHAASRSLSQGVSSGGRCPFHGAKDMLVERLSGPTPREIAPDDLGLPIPGPEGALSLEAGLDLTNIITSGVHGAMLQFQAKYGDICRFSNPTDLNGASSWVFLMSCDNVQHVCATNVRNYETRFLPDIYQWVTEGKGILGSQGEYNRKHRRLCQPPFRSPALLETFSNVIVQRSLHAAQQWGTRTDFVTDVAVHTQRLALDVVGLTAFSHDFKQVDQMSQDLSGSIDEEAGAHDRLLQAFNDFGTILSQVFITPLPILKLLDRLGVHSLRKLSQACDTMQDVMLPVIGARRAEIEAGQVPADDLLSKLMTSRDEDGSAMTDHELWEDVHDIMGAGHETTATTTAALLHCVAAHPEVEAAVREELDAVLGGRPATYEDLPRLSYLGQVVKEVLRLYPAIPLFPRQAGAADMLPSGHRVDAGDVVFMSTYAMGRNPKLWDNTLDFDPSRFAPENLEKMHRYQWLPFGAGPRMCLGANFAEMSVLLMGATLMQHHKFVPEKPDLKLLNIGYDITMNFDPMGGLRMRVISLGDPAGSSAGQAADRELTSTAA